MYAQYFYPKICFSPNRSLPHPLRSDVGPRGPPTLLHGTRVWPVCFSRTNHCLESQPHTQRYTWYNVYVYTHNPFWTLSRCYKTNIYVQSPVLVLIKIEIEFVWLWNMCWLLETIDFEFLEPTLQTKAFYLIDRTLIYNCLHKLYVNI